jgi:AcrR family transcriptional regulator
MTVPDSPGDGTSPTTVTATRGRPFSRQTERAILDATTALLAERPLSEIALDDIAARARVSKASIYRRWPSKGTLAFEAFMSDFLDRQPLPDTGRLADDLLAALRNWVRTVDATAAGRTLKGLIVNPVRARHLIMTDRAIARGELPPRANTDLILDLLYGPAYHRLLHGHLPLDDAFVTGIIKTIRAAVDAGVF